ncbi:hypothetical protein Q4491_07575 [Photobacterium sp. 2_MG-2023]|uniref:hypothetical protein n=1 Tax=Photobacterium sp. 2_MG-2023 TaxID=3062663 RepID=UPI0026E15F4A|nr:hypothetical protein [Photobacterium sp. 2_MG-2023]MDO6581205.1 hypothetical protein [Photobacterium sp. 2_MG-2023]
MALTIIALCLVTFYFYFNKEDVIYFDALLSVLVMIVYITAYIYFSANFPLHIKRAGLICELLPAASLCAILFPDWSTRFSPEVTVRLGWAGLLLSCIILALLVIFIA